MLSSSKRDRILATGSVLVAVIFAANTFFVTHSVKRGVQETRKLEVLHRQYLALRKQITDIERPIGTSSFSASAPPVVVYTPAVHPSTSSAQVQRTPSPDVLSPVIPRSAATISMAVDKQSASPGQTLEYTITLSNLEGRTTQFDVTSHVPPGTTFQSSDNCPAGSLGLDSIAICAPVRGRAGWHQIQFSKTLPTKSRYAFRFTVVIDPDHQVGSVISNHAHVSGPRIEYRTSNATETPVQPAAKPPQNAAKPRP